jgi:hypothetical protein
MTFSFFAHPGPELSPWNRGLEKEVRLPSWVAKRRNHEVSVARPGIILEIRVGHDQVVKLLGRVEEAFPVWLGTLAAYNPHPCGLLISPFLADLAEYRHGCG